MESLASGEDTAFDVVRDSEYARNCSNQQEANSLIAVSLRLLQYLYLFLS